MKKIAMFVSLAFASAAAQAAPDFVYGRAGIASMPVVKDSPSISVGAGWNTQGWSDTTVVQAKVFSANSKVNLLVSTGFTVPVGSVKVAPHIGWGSRTHLTPSLDLLVPITDRTNFVVGGSIFQQKLAGAGSEIEVGLQGRF